MKRMILLIALCGILWSVGEAQTNVNVARYYNYPLNDPILSGLQTIRCVAVVKNLEGDGKTLIAATNYNDKGRVCIFTPSVTGNALELVWTSPKVDTTPTSGGGYQSPRNVLFADLDGDGKQEIIFESTSNGVYVFEWDGVKGSHNFGKKPSQLAGLDNLPDFTKIGAKNQCEHMEVADVDGDGQQELVLAYKGPTAAENKYMIISAVGDWATDEPGFSGFTMEFVKSRADLAGYGVDAGSCNSMMVGNLNGSARKQVILQAYANMSVTIVRSTGANTYELADNTNSKGFAQLLASDGVGYFGGMTTDIDKDGCDEIYVPTSYGDATNVGQLHMISYAKGESVSEIDTTKNRSIIDFLPLTTGGLLGITAGDVDGNGKPNIYVTSPVRGANILTAEFQGGNKKDPKNWKTSVFYKGDTTIYQALSIRDSLGRIDTTSRTVNLMFPSKIVGGVDIDNNGREELVCGMQPWDLGNADSISISKTTWNATKKAYDTTAYKVVNLKRYTIQVLERNATTGVIEARNMQMVTPEDYQLNQNYPNPFNPSTQITFTLPLTKKVSVKVYDLLGKEVRTLINNEEYTSGSHTITWNGRDNKGASVSSGTYIYTLKTDYVEKSMKMMLVK
jgi:hypothetical protein